MKVAARGALLGLCLATPGASQLSTNSPPLLPVENLGTPVITMESAGFTAYSRSGEPHHLLFFHPMRRPMDCQVRIINLATGKVVEAGGPPDRPLRMVELDGKYYLGQYGLIGLWIYDPETMSLRFTKGPDLGRLIAFSMTVGPDRKVYMGTASGDCRVVRYDPETDRFRDHGTQGPAIRDARYIHSIATDGDFVYSAAGKNPWFLVALNIKSGRQEILLRDAKYLSVRDHDGIATAEVTLPGVRGEADRKVAYVLKGGRMFECERAATDSAGNTCLLLRDKREMVVFDATSKAPRVVALKQDYDAIWAGPPGAVALGREGGLLFFHEGADQGFPVALAAPKLKVTALAWLPDGRVAFATSGSGALTTYDPGTRQCAEVCRIQLPASAGITTLVAEGGHLYGATSPRGGFIVHTGSWKSVEFPCGGHIERIRGRLWASEQGVSYPRGDSVFVPARLRLDRGRAIPDPACAGYDMRHHAWTDPDVVLGTMQPDGEFKMYWRLPDGTDWGQASARIRALPVNIERLHALPDGRVFGTTRRYQECFLYDRAKNSFEVLPGRFPVSNPCIESLGGRIYLMGYPGGTFLEYDPTREWTLGDNPTRRRPPMDSPESNPRMLFQFSRLGDQAPSHHIVASALGSDGCLYFGGHQERKAVGGGIGWWDVKAGKAGALREPFLVQDCAGLAAASGGKTLVYSSRVVADPAGRIPTPAEAKLFVFDVHTRRLTAEHAPFAGAGSAGQILAREQLVYGFVKLNSAWHFYAFDLDAAKVVAKVVLPFAGDVRSPLWGPEGRIWFFADSLLASVDPTTTAFRAYGSVEDPGAGLFLDGDLYLAGKEPLRRIRNARSLPPLGPPPRPVAR